MWTNTVQSAGVRAITRHPFAASAILTLHAPNRTTNRVDLNIFRRRFPAFIDDCRVRTTDAYGVGARLRRSTVPADVLRAPVNITAEPGDVFLFNSEFLHDTPKIVGESARTVFNSFAGWSKDHAEVELYT